MHRAGAIFPSNSFLASDHDECRGQIKFVEIKARELWLVTTPIAI
jgi:hypothetical protein